MWKKERNVGRHIDKEKNGEREQVKGVVVGRAVPHGEWSTQEKQLGLIVLKPVRTEGVWLSSNGSGPG